VFPDAYRLRGSHGLLCSRQDQRQISAQAICSTSDTRACNNYSRNNSLTLILKTKMTPKDSFRYAIAECVHKTRDNTCEQILRIAFISLVLVLIGNVSSAQLYSEDAAIEQA